MYLAKTPEAIKPLAGDLLWNFARSEKTVYLTFDDGPTVNVTEKVLDLLSKYKAQATFFCIGGNVKSNPSIYKSIVDSGHSVGNHTWNHMNGWKYSDYSYYRNVLECEELIDSNLFRPPYGRITRSQVKGLKDRFKIVMWDVLSGDWKADLSEEKCLNNVLKNAQEGSIIVFHDSLKAEKNMLYALEGTLDHFSEKGFSFKGI